MKAIFWWLVCCAVALGLFIGWVDTRPTWDDTGITVFIVLIVTALFGVMSPKHAWIWALAVAGGIVLFNIGLSRNYGAMLVLPIGFIGSYGGAWLRSTLQRNS